VVRRGCKCSFLSFADSPAEVGSVSLDLARDGLLVDLRGSKT